MSILVMHTYADGTLVDGTQRGDGSAAVLKTCGLRWSHRLGMWFMPHSRDKPAARVEMVAAALRAAGFDVEVDVNDSPPDLAEREAIRAQRAAERQAALKARAARLDARARRSYDAASKLLGLIPPGQPILAGHHSASRHRRDLDRIQRGFRATARDDRDAAALRRRARASEAQLAARDTFPVIGRRLERLEREQRAQTRRLARIPDADAKHLRDEAAETARQLDYWRDRRADLIASGAAQDWGPLDFEIGDRVQQRHHWATVVRVNKRTLTIHSDGMPKGITHKVPYYEITDHQPATPPATDQQPPQ